MGEYASIFLNATKYSWKYLNKLFWLCQGSEYTWSSYIFDRLLKMPWTLNVPGLWIWHRYIWKGYTEFWIWLNMTQYASIMPGYVTICLNVPQYAWDENSWMSVLNIPENGWINYSDYTRVLNMPHHLRYLTGFWICRRHQMYQGSEYLPRYSYNDIIIIITNVIIL